MSSSTRSIAVSVRLLSMMLSARHQPRTANSNQQQARSNMSCEPNTNSTLPYMHRLNTANNSLPVPVRMLLTTAGVAVHFPPGVCFSRPCAGPPECCMLMKESSSPCPNIAGMADFGTTSRGLTVLMSQPALRLTLLRIKRSASFSIICSRISVNAT